MSQPTFIPSPNHDKALGVTELQGSRSWSQSHRLAQKSYLRAPGRFLGTPGPSQGFGLKLVKQKLSKIVLVDTEEIEDVVHGLSVLVNKRASLFSRSPIAYDVDFFIKLFGFDGTQDFELLEFRKIFFKGASHSYLVQRQIADVIPDSTLRMTLKDLSDSPNWRALIGIA